MTMIECLEILGNSRTGALFKLGYKEKEATKYCRLWRPARHAGKPWRRFRKWVHYREKLSKRIEKLSEPLMKEMANRAKKPVDS